MTGLCLHSKKHRVPPSRCIYAVLFTKVVSLVKMVKVVKLVKIGEDSASLDKTLIIPNRLDTLHSHRKRKKSSVAQCSTG